MGRLSHGLWALVACVLLTWLWLRLPHPLLLPAVGLAIPAIWFALRWPFLMVLGFVTFSFFRLHEVFPPLYPLKVPLLLSLAAIGALAWHIVLSGRIKPYWSPVLSWLSAFFIIASIGVLFANNRGEAMAAWTGSYSKIYLMTLATAWLVRTPADFALAVRTFVVAGSMVALVALYNKANGIGLVEETRVTIGRELGSVLGDPNDLALVLLFPAGFSVSLLLNPGSWVGRALGGIGFILTAAAIIATQSRGGLLGICAVGGVFAWQRVQSKTLLIMLGTVAMMVLFVAAGISERASGGAAESGVDASAMGRLYAWQAAWGMALDHPFIGVGLNNFYYNYYFYSPHWDGLNHAVHSTWFGVLAETGFVGLVLFVGMVSVAIRSAWRCQLEGMPPAVATAMQGVIASMMGFVISGSFLTQGFTWPIYLELALALAVIRYAQHASDDMSHPASSATSAQSIRK
ncbi:O-antigen ligase family protein [Aeromonas cavernicola]|uniref:Oligosaccharide repeat unit polymerase n=1 Tax=Aeromonas cavernicola TaxID=1006623 RepID=A0A2H9U815_9GAMM|nr:O-antigen ligase family protein [Aeromonas cavernicola]PJG60142.1 oligosaccharide repeat unit polymerase [Aeromonas cavernicola]